MDGSSGWACVLCRHGRDDVADLLPCLHQLCLGCALWWAKKKPHCSLCGGRLQCIKYSVRSADDHLQCPVAEPREQLGDGQQDDRGLQGWCSGLMSAASHPTSGQPSSGSSWLTPGPSFRVVALLLLEHCRLLHRSQ